MQAGLVAYEGREYDPSRFLQPETVAKVIADTVNAPRDAHIHEVVVRRRDFGARRAERRLRAEIARRRG